MRQATTKKSTADRRRPKEKTATVVPRQPGSFLAGPGLLQAVGCASCLKTARRGMRRACALIAMNGYQRGGIRRRGGEKALTGCPNVNLVRSA